MSVDAWLLILSLACAVLIASRGYSFLDGDLEMKKYQKFRWIRHNGERFENVGILADGTVHNPNGYPEDVVIEAVNAAIARRHQRRSDGAKKAAVARRLAGGGQLTPQTSCIICGRGLDDPESIKQGVGSECWQDVLTALE